MTDETTAKLREMAESRVKSGTWTDGIHDGTQEAVGGGLELAYDPTYAALRGEHDWMDVADFVVCVRCRWNDDNAEHDAPDVCLDTSPDALLAVAAEMGFDEHHWYEGCGLLAIEGQNKEGFGTHQQSTGATFNEALALALIAAAVAQG